MRVFPAQKQNSAPDSMAMICTIEYDGVASQRDYIDEQSRLYLWIIPAKQISSVQQRVLQPMVPLQSKVPQINNQS